MTSALTPRELLGRRQTTRKAVVEDLRKVYVLHRLLHPQVHVTVMDAKKKKNTRYGRR